MPAPRPHADDAAEHATSLWADAWRRLAANRLALAGLAFLVLIALASFLAPFISPYSYEAQDLAYGPRPPTVQHWFGTDAHGRDLLTRCLYGGRVSITVGLLATAVSLLIGVLYGAVSGYFGGRLDNVMMRFVDILYALPFTVFVILLMVAFGQDIRLLFIAIGAVSWLTMARIVRGQILALREQEFVEAAVSLGLTSRRIILRHLIPNVLGPIIIYATLTVPAVMLLEAMLSFLGLGVQAPMSSWGLLIKDGAAQVGVRPWLLIFPAAMFSSTLFSLNFLGDGLRDALDPKSAED